MKTLICGSMAYDTIMVFKDQFKKHILPEQIHILNVAFLVPEMRREYGGCAGNIAYNLQMLGGHPLIMATVGDDFEPYTQRLKNIGLAQTHIRHVPGNFTGQAFITTDLDDNQITAFHPGAMSMSHLNHVNEAKEVTLGIVSPDGRDGMINHAREFAEANIPFVFDPGQGMPMFSGAELLDFIEQANYVTVNDYEAKMLQDKTGKIIGRYRAARHRVDRHARCRWFALFMPTADRSPSPRRSRKPLSIRPVAAMPIARACCTASSKAGIGKRQDAWLH